jgi:hypothetical protein
MEMWFGRYTCSNCKLQVYGVTEVRGKRSNRRRQSAPSTVCAPTLGRRSPRLRGVRWEVLQLPLHQVPGGDVHEADPVFSVGDGHKGPLITEENRRFLKNNNEQLSSQTASHATHIRGPR